MSSIEATNFNLEQKKNFIITTINELKCSKEKYYYCQDKECTDIHLCSYSNIINCTRNIWIKICPYGDNCNRVDRDYCNHLHSKQILQWYQIYLSTNNKKIMCNTIINYLNLCFDNMVLYRRRKINEILLKKEEIEYRKREEEEYRKREEEEYRKREEEEYRKREEEEYRKKKIYEERMKAEEIYRKQQDEKELYIEFQKMEELRRFELFKKEREIIKFGFANSLPPLPPPPAYLLSQNALFLKKRAKSRSPSRRY